MAKGPFGGPRPFADDETVLSFIFGRTIQQGRMRLEDMIIEQVNEMPEMEVAKLSTVTSDEGSMIVDIEIEENGAKLSALNQLKSNIESHKAAMDIRPGQLREIVIR